MLEVYDKRRPHPPCPEPDGNREIELYEGRYYYAHDIMLVEQGQCPWCGAEPKAP